LIRVGALTPIVDGVGLEAVVGRREDECAVLTVKVLVAISLWPSSSVAVRVTL
jgi:hypothetical protein